MAYHSCKNCNQPFGTSYKFCPNCGQIQADTLTLKELFNNEYVLCSRKFQHIDLQKNSYRLINEKDLPTEKEKDDDEEGIDITNEMDVENDDYNYNIANNQNNSDSDTDSETESEG